MNRPGARLAFGLALSAYAVAKTRKMCQVSYDRAWVQRWPDGVFVEPKPSLMPLSALREAAYDRWMYNYRGRPGDIIVDVGAGAGGETIFFSELVGTTGHVIAIEAHPYTFFCLKETCRLNRLWNVIPINCAITAEECQLLITDNEEYIINRIGLQEGDIAVRGLALDKIEDLNHFSHIDLLKVNIEGSEGSAIAGMSLTIQKTHHVCFSCHDFLAIGEKSSELGFCTRKVVIEFLEQNGFDILIRERDSRSEVRDYVYGVNRKFTAQTRAEGDPREISLPGTQKYAKAPMVQAGPTAS